jgi:hypothetical protein
MRIMRMTSPGSNAVEALFVQGWTAAVDKLDACAAWALDGEGLSCL